VTEASAAEPRRRCLGRTGLVGPDSPLQRVTAPNLVREPAAKKTDVEARLTDCEAFAIIDVRARAVLAPL
jgi:hypothetical protein